MKGPRNWRLWSGLGLAIVAFLSYFLFFAKFPITRDVPWVSFILFIAAVALLISGWRRAPRKVLASIVTIVGVLVFGGFTYLVTVFSRNIPASRGAPAVGARAPEFVLPDSRGRNVSLQNLLAQSNGVVLVFYRGYW